MSQGRSSAALGLGLLISEEASGETALCSGSSNMAVDQTRSSPSSSQVTSSTTSVCPSFSLPHPPPFFQSALPSLTLSVLFRGHLNLEWSRPSLSWAVPFTLLWCSVSQYSTPVIKIPKVTPGASTHPAWTFECAHCGSLSFLSPMKFLHHAFVGTEQWHVVLW